VHAQPLLKNAHKLLNFKWFEVDFNRNVFLDEEGGESIIGFRTDAQVFHQLLTKLFQILVHPFGIIIIELFY